MGPQRLARLLEGRLHYGWIVVGVMFVVILATVGVRAAPGVLIVPLEEAFGWDAATISGAISLNILLGGLIGPFAAALSGSSLIRSHRAADRASEAAAASATSASFEAKCA